MFTGLHAEVTFTRPNGRSQAKPTLYHYFRSKEEILRSIHEEFIQLLTEKYLQRVSTGAEPEELALGAMKDILSLMVTHRGYVRVFFEHHRELPPDAKRYVTAQRDAYESLVQSAIGAGQARGHFTRNADAKLVTLALFGMCNWAYQWFDVRGRYTADEIAETYWRLLLNGIQPAVDRLQRAGAHEPSGVGQRAEHRPSRPYPCPGSVPEDGSAGGAGASLIVPGVGWVRALRPSRRLWRGRYELAGAGRGSRVGRAHSRDRGPASRA